MVQRSKTLFLVGALAFFAALFLMYMKDPGRVPDIVLAVLPMTSPNSAIEPESQSGPSARAEPISGEIRHSQQTLSQTTHAGQFARGPDRESSRTPDYQAPRTTLQEAETEVEPINPAARLSIAGRVLGPGGKPVAGIRLTARHRAVGDGLRDDKAHGARSDAGGNYEFSGLLQGEYYVRTAATASYPVTGENFRAGMRSADIVLVGNQSVQISGRVTDTAGYGLINVEVKPSGTDAVTVWTDATGNFRTQAPGVRPGTTFSVLFRLEGYLEERAYVQYGDINAQGQARLNVQLLGLEGTVKVSGVLRGADGKMVAGESVQLDSPSLNNRYRETSQPDGSFVFPAVEPGGDYRLSIHPRSAYESYYQQAIDIQPPSATLSATLQPIETGRLTGRMIDSDGAAMGGFSMTLRSNKSQSNYIEVTGDEGGYFTLENAPAGNLVFATRSQPQFNVSGITLEAGGSADVELVIDWGDNEFSGRVRDDSRRPVTGANVQLSGQYDGRGVRSNSLRRTTTDSEGNFRFSELGGGMHTLTVRMNGFETATRAVDTGALLGNVDIELTTVGD